MTDSLNIAALLIGLGLLARILNLLFVARQRLDHLSNRDAIAEIISNYAHTWDAKDADGFMALFTKDTVVEHWDSGALKSTVEGRETLRQYARTSFEGCAGILT